jgi:hypothetical protein
MVGRRLRHRLSRGPLAPAHQPLTPTSRSYLLRDLRYGERLHRRQRHLLSRNTGTVTRHGMLTSTATATDGWPAANDYRDGAWLVTPGRSRLLVL